MKNALHNGPFVFGSGELTSGASRPEVGDHIGDGKKLSLIRQDCEGTWCVSGVDCRRNMAVVKSVWVQGGE